MPKHEFQPESLMMSYGYKPELSEGSLKCPIFQTSTFVFEKAEDGKSFFELAVGLRKPENREKAGLIYSRINNPDMEILEDRLTLWDKAEACAVFESGMSAISTTLLEFLKPGDLLLYSNPLYGGTSHFIHDILTRFGIHVLPFPAGVSEKELLLLLKESGIAEKLAMIFIETPANPTNMLVDIEMCRRVADLVAPEKRPLIAVDNTFLGPVFLHPLKHGADLVIYSATKYIGGHSDVIAGACLGSVEHIKRLKSLRSHLGSMISPWTGWLLLRSLETLKIRMEKQVENALKVADYLKTHPKVRKVYYLGHLTERDGRQYDIYKKQCLAPGAMISFDIKGGEKEAFQFLNRLKMIHLAVSLGSTESLVQHPYSMTHAGVPAEEKIHFGLTDSLVRLSVGVENIEDILWDLGQAFDAVSISESLALEPMTSI
jgi:methionine-gamma-lyase